MIRYIALMIATSTKTENPLNFKVFIAYIKFTEASGHCEE